MLTQLTELVSIESASSQLSVLEGVIASLSNLCRLGRIPSFLPLSCTFAESNNNNNRGPMPTCRGLVPQATGAVIAEHGDRHTVQRARLILALMFIWLVIYLSTLPKTHNIGLFTHPLGVCACACAEETKMKCLQAGMVPWVRERAKSGFSEIKQNAEKIFVLIGWTQAGPPEDYLLAIKYLSSMMNGDVEKIDHCIWVNGTPLSLSLVVPSSLTILYRNHRCAPTRQFPPSSQIRSQISISCSEAGDCSG